MSTLEQICSLIMLLSGTGAVLLLWAALIIEHQRRELATMHRHCLRLTFQRQAANWRYRALRAHLLALAVVWDFEPVVVV
jgi:hypothetical protein